MTKDERFVTARHCMQSLWKVGVIGRDPQNRLIDGLAVRFTECAVEKNRTLIRDESIRLQAQAWIATEPDGKYRKKYSTVWSKR